MQNKTTSIEIIFLCIMASLLCVFATLRETKLSPAETQSRLIIGTTQFEQMLEVKPSRKLYLPRPAKSKQPAELIADRGYALSKKCGGK